MRSLRSYLWDTWTRTGRATRGHRGYLGAAAGLLSLGLLMLAGCQLGGGQSGSRNATPPPAPTLGTIGPFLTITPGAPPKGAAAIRPHLNAVPAFTTQDMTQYVTSRPPAGSSGTPSISRSAFVTSQEVSQRTGVLFGRAAATIVGYVELTGKFSFANLTGGPPFTYQSAFEVFDAQTGNLLIYGGLQPQPTPTPTPNSRPLRR